MIRATLLPALIALAASVSVSASAQTPRPALDYASAAKIRDTCVAWASTRGLSIVVVVYDARAMPVAMAHMDDVSMAANEVAQWKANASAKFGRATGDFAATPPPAGVPNVATIAGGVPVYTADGVLIAGVGVSGAKATEDAACATAGIEAAGLKPARLAPTAQ